MKKIIKISSESRLNYLFERIKFYQEYCNFDNPIIIEKIFYNNLSNNEYKQLVDFNINFN